MSRTVHRPTAASCLIVASLLASLLEVNLLAQSLAGSGTAVSTANIQSDAAAIQAMANVIEKSGGEAVWRDITSAKETFSVSAKDNTAQLMVRLLNDWSTESTRYRRKVQGQTRPPIDHNGNATYSADNGTKQLRVPELDQARTMVATLPAAAVSIMLRRTEYVLKISKTQTCRVDDICIDVFRTAGPTLPVTPEQQWKISSSSGLPYSIRYQVTVIGTPSMVVWREAYFPRYDSEEGITIPVSITLNLRGQWQSWTFVSLKKNPGFDTASFDRENVQ